MAVTSPPDQKVFRLSQPEAEPVNRLRQPGQFLVYPIVPRIFSEFPQLLP